MYVIKRDGRREKLTIDKIRKVTKPACEGLVGVSYNELETKAKISFKDGIKTTDIQKALIDSALSLIDFDKPNYQYVAARLQLYNLYHNIAGITGYRHLKDTIAEGHKYGIYIKGLEDEYDLEELNNYIKPERDLLFNHMGMINMLSRYLKHIDGKYIEAPQHMFMLIAIYLAKNEKDKMRWAKEFYDILSKFEVMIATPGLSNARMKRHQLSSCMVLSTPDNIEGIFKCYDDAGKLSKFGAGLGWDWNLIRAIRSKIDYAYGAAGGPIPFLKIANDIMLAVDQLGCVTRDSYIKIKESDIEKTIPIYKARIGDIVKCYNIETNEVEWKPIEEVHDLQVKLEDQVYIEFSNGNCYTTSAWHPTPRFENSKLVYVEAEKINVGDISIDEDNNRIEIVKVLKGDDVSEIDINTHFADLTVKDNNNYFCSSYRDDTIFTLIHNTRKGSATTYMEPWNKSILNFIDLKLQSGEERERAHDLFLAVWGNSLFYHRASKEVNGTWSLFNPYDVPKLRNTYGEEWEKAYIEYESDKSIDRITMNARELWRNILKNLFETGAPFITYKDNANKANMNKHAGIIRSSNLCTEILQNTEPPKVFYRIIYEDNSVEEILEDELPKDEVPTIFSIRNGKRVTYVNKYADEAEIAVCNLASINLSKVNSDDDLKRVCPIVTRMIDNTIDLNYFPVLGAKNHSEKYRAIGIGVMGEMHMLANKGIHFGSKEHYELLDELMESYSYYIIQASMELAREKGSYSMFDGSEWSKGILPIDFATEEAKKLTTRKYSKDWDTLRENIKTNGIRNGYLMAIAPTSSISLTVGTSQAIEPIYKRKWYEVTILGEVPMLAPDISPNTWEYYISAYEIDQHKIIEAGAIRQKWIDQGQSLNIFIQKDKADARYLDLLYMKANDLGLKTTYYLRSQTVTIDDADVQDRSLECDGCQ